MCCEGEPPSPTWHRDVFIAGCVGGTAAVIYSCPLEVIKIKLQSQTGNLKLIFTFVFFFIIPAPLKKKKCFLLCPYFQLQYPLNRLQYAKYFVKRNPYIVGHSMHWLKFTKIMVSTGDCIEEDGACFGGKLKLNFALNFHLIKFCKLKLYPNKKCSK